MTRGKNRNIWSFLMCSVRGFQLACRRAQACRFVIHSLHKHTHCPPLLRDETPGPSKPCWYRHHKAWHSTARDTHPNRPTIHKPQHQGKPFHDPHRGSGDETVAHNWETKPVLETASTKTGIEWSTGRTLCGQEWRIWGKQWWRRKRYVQREVMYRVNSGQLGCLVFYFKWENIPEFTQQRER